MQVPTAQQPSSLAIEGLSKLRKAALLMMIASLLVAIGLVVGVMLLLSALPTTFAGEIVGIRAEEVISKTLGAIIGGTSTVIIGFILQLVALFAFLIPAFSRLKEYNATAFGTSATLIKIGYVVGTILVLIGLVTVIGSLLARSLGGITGGGIVVVIGAIFLLIGFIGLIIGCFRLKDSFQETLFLVAGILFIIAIIIAFIPYISSGSFILDLIAWIMIYVAAGSSIRKLQTQQPQALATPPSTYT